MIKALQIQYDEYFDLALDCAARAGFRNISLGFGSSDCFHHEDWEKRVAEIDRKLAARGLCCLQTHLPYYSLLIDAQEIDPAMDTAMRRCLRAGRLLGASWNVYHARTSLKNNNSPRRSLALAKEAVAPLAETAHREGTGLALENLPVFPGMYDKRFFTSDYEDLCALSDHFSSEFVAVCWDFGHAHLMKFDQPQAIRTVGSRIKATHVHNNGQIEDDHYLPSQGSMPWPAVMAALRDTGFDGALTLEINYTGSPYLESFFRHALDCLDWLCTLAAEEHTPAT